MKKGIKSSDHFVKFVLRNTEVKYRHFSIGNV
jgi:hypothetical protein